MHILLIILTYILLFFNFGAPKSVSNVSDFVLVLEHTIVLCAAYRLISRMLKCKSLTMIFYTKFLFGYSICLLMIATWWGDELVTKATLNMEAFDPIKYYTMASYTVKGMDVPTIIFFPIAYIYAGVMYVIGINPLTPFFFNQLLLLYAILLIAKFINRETPEWIKYYSLLLVVPEIMYFDIMSSKDIVCMICSVVILIKACEMVEGKRDARNIIIFIISFFLMFTARASFALIAIVSVVLSNIDIRKLNIKKLFLIFALAGVTIIVMYYGGESGAGNIATSSASKFSAYVSGDVSDAAELEGQSSSSFARLIVPHNTFEFIVFGVIRSICYIVIDPRFITSPIALFTFFHDKNYPFSPFVAFTTLLMFISCFLFISYRKYLKFESTEVKHVLIALIVYFLVVGMSTPTMIHIRYRVVYDMLFFAIAIRAYLYRHKKFKGYDNNETRS